LSGEGLRKENPIELLKLVEGEEEMEPRGGREKNKVAAESRSRIGGDGKES